MTPVRPVRRFAVLGAVVWVSVLLAWIVLLILAKSFLLLNAGPYSVLSIPAIGLLGGTFGALAWMTVVPLRLSSIRMTTFLLGAVCVGYVAGAGSLILPHLMYIHPGRSAFPAFDAWLNISGYFGLPAAAVIMWRTVRRRAQLLGASVAPIPKKSDVVVEIPRALVVFVGVGLFLVPAVRTLQTCLFVLPVLLF